MESNYISGTIDQIASKTKFLEFKDGLIPASKESYAELEGPYSGIRLEITDYSAKENGGETKIGAVTIPTYLCRKLESFLLAECREPGIETQAEITKKVNSLISGSIKANSDISMLRSGFCVLANELVSGLAKIIKDADSAKPFHEMGSVALAVKNALKASSAAVQDSGFTIPVSGQFSYEQTRVNSKYPNSDGTCNVSTLQIIRSPVGSNGVVYKLPWYIALSKFRAKPESNANSGTVSYIRSTIDQKTKLDLNFRAGDEDMLRCMYKVNRFIEEFDRAQLSGFIEGVEARKANWKNRKREK